MELAFVIFGLQLLSATAVHDADVLNLYKHQFHGDVSTK